jgi:hypothetical protein
MNGLASSEINEHSSGRYPGIHSDDVMARIANFPRILRV